MADSIEWPKPPKVICERLASTLLVALSAANKATVGLLYIILFPLSNVGIPGDVERKRGENGSERVRVRVVLMISTHQTSSFSLITVIASISSL